MQEQLLYTTSVMSVNFIQSALKRAEGAVDGAREIDLNLEAPSTIVLCCISIEAFCNEVSSLSSAFVHNAERESHHNISQDEIMSLNAVNEASNIRRDGDGCFYKRYKRLLRSLKISDPEWMSDLVHLRALRDSLVHFRTCDVPIVEDKDGLIRYVQEPPDVFKHLKGKRVSGRLVIACSNGDAGIDWTLRMSTSAMAAWALRLTCDTILYVLDTLPVGKYRDFVLQAYRPRDKAFRDLFCKLKEDISNLENAMF